ncbi:MAG TPA: hypothetical protein VFP72_07545 [Kineosporiaceae bacterium]|nr:hypothetical protein [Kineosporiaceae bacterium]
MSSVLPPDHPDPDLLADLAADVLPTHQARVVEAHVMACSSCYALLTDAAQVRELLLRDDPGPMPPDVLARLESVIQIEAAARDGLAEHPVPSPPTPQPVRAPAPQPGTDRSQPAPARPDQAQPNRSRPGQAQPYAQPAGRLPRNPLTPAAGTTRADGVPHGEPSLFTTPQAPVQPPPRTPTQPVRVVTPWDDTTTIEAYEAARRRQTARRPEESASSAAAATAGAGPAARTRGPRLSRPSRGPSRSRRDLRQEIRDVRAGKRGTVLAAAAGVVVLVGLGGYVVVGLLGNRETGSASTAASSVQSLDAPRPGAAAGGPPVLSTGTDYTQAALGTQARTLVKQVDGTGPRTMAAKGAAAGTSPSAAPGTTTATSAQADGGNVSLQDPKALNGCLSALQAGGRRPVAVDLARYEGREAAIIVLNGINGGYEVWAVARDCRPGADGTITYLSLAN